MLSKHAALAVPVLSVALFAGEARAEIRFYIDCNHSDIDHEDTSDTIKVRLYNGDEPVYSQEERGPSCGAVSDAKFVFNEDFFWTDQKDDKVVTHVEVYTDGENAFFIDEALFDPDEGSERNFGADDKRGWCLSRDPSDGKSWGDQKVFNCSKGLRFDVRTGEVKPIDSPWSDEEVRKAAERASKTSYYFSLDCHHNDLQNEDTKNLITARLYSGSKELASVNERTRRQFGVIEGCWSKDARVIFSGIPKADNPTHIVLNTNGDDGFFIDEAYLERSGGTELQHWGTDDKRGWCLSTDPTDGDRTWKDHVSGCHDELWFQIGSGEVDKK